MFVYLSWELFYYPVCICSYFYQSQGPTQEQSNGGGIKYTKTEKKFGYNNRLYTVYKASNKQYVIFTNKKALNVKSIQPQTEKKTAGKYEYNGNKYETFVTLAPTPRKFIKIMIKESSFEWIVK